MANIASASPTVCCLTITSSLAVTDSPHESDGPEGSSAPAAHGAVRHHRIGKTAPRPRTSDLTLRPDQRPGYLNHNSRSTAASYSPLWAYRRDVAPLGDGRTVGPDDGIWGPRCSYSDISTVHRMSASHSPLDWRATSRLKGQHRDAFGPVLAASTGVNEPPLHPAHP